MENITEDEFTDKISQAARSAGLPDEGVAAARGFVTLLKGMFNENTPGFARARALLDEARVEAGGDESKVLGLWAQAIMREPAFIEEMGGAFFRSAWAIINLLATSGRAVGSITPTL